MDMYGTDRKLSELGVDFLDQDMFTPPTNDMEPYGLTENTVGQDWLENFFDDPVLNDRMITEALQPPNVRSEHSYSMANGNTTPTSPLNLKIENMDKDLEADLLGAVNPNMTLTQNGNTVTTTMTKSDRLTPGTTVSAMSLIRPDPHYDIVKQEPLDFSHTKRCAMATTSVPMEVAATTTTTHTVALTRSSGQTLLKQPTIILATQPSVQTMQIKQERLVLPKVNIKVEPMDCHASSSSSPEHQSMYDGIGLPPTPPSSSNCSDSEGSLSPLRSEPSSPIRHSSQLSRHHQGAHQRMHGGMSSQPLFTSPIPTSGVLILSEEEKRTLISEGYPIPAKLPLTKQEEKNLKKIRRKIKNKISAQESRRKKKEYLETLEKRMESYNQENCDLKKKVDHLENNNRSLLSQLQKLQTLVGKVRPSAASSTQTGTCLMVLVLFFAVFMGTWSPMSLSVGYLSSSSSSPAAASFPLSAGVMDSVPFPVPKAAPSMGPEIQDALSDAYATPNMRSRVLMSLKDEAEEFGPHVPFSYKDFFMRWFSSSCPEKGAPAADKDFTLEMSLPHVANGDTDRLRLANVTVAQYSHDQAVYTRASDLAPNYTAQVMTAPPLNATA